jgi:DNA-directed RNA polymerase subunit beta'
MKTKEVVITSDSGEVASSPSGFGSRLRVEAGDRVEAGQMITDGSIHPHDILRVVGVRGVQEYITSEVQRVYRLQGVDINDKHVEIIIKQMLGKMKVDEVGDTKLLEGSVISVREFNAENKRIAEEGGEIATGTRSLLGITKASLATESFLSAASFQETTRVLTDAAINGKEDRLVGLKENVLIGKLIPAGTGMKKYNDVAIQKHESLQPADDEYKVLL